MTDGFSKHRFPDCATRYPVVLVHGTGYMGREIEKYWGRVPQCLAQAGAQVYLERHNAWGCIEDNAHQIGRSLRKILRDSGAQKVNLIAHSKGGLDCRYLIGALGMGPNVASLTTIATPHHGLRFADFCCRLPDGLYRGVGRRVDGYFRQLGEPNPDFYTTTHQFTTGFSANFNRRFPVPKDIYTQSFGVLLRHRRESRTFFYTGQVIRLFDGENDGLVPLWSARWSNFRGVVGGHLPHGVSHSNIVDMGRRDYQGFSVLEFYLQLVADLKTRGF